MVSKNGDLDAKFYVVEGAGDCLLGFKTAQALGLIQVLCPVTSDNLIERFPNVFAGTGKFINGQIKLHIDSSVPPVVQTHNRVPFHLRPKLEEELARLQKADIIEPAAGPSSWISPVVMVPKPHNHDKLRLCVDMRAANRAVLRERHELPTIDDLVTRVNGAAVFSKLDLREGFHQFEIEEDCRDNTTFYTHAGLFRYKRLFFGISSAPEKFQSCIRQIIQPVKNAINISDDILVFGRTQTEHDAALN